MGAEQATRLDVPVRVLHPGSAVGAPLVLTEPLSFWGGTDEEGVVVDEHHPQRGASLTGKVLAMPTARGSSSSSSVLAEQIRRGTAPAALVLAAPDAILVLGAWVAAELYGRDVPVVVVDDYAAGAAALGGHPRAAVEATAGEEPVVRGVDADRG